MEHTAAFNGIPIQDRPLGWGWRLVSVLVGTFGVLLSCVARGKRDGQQQLCPPLIGAVREAVGWHLGGCFPEHWRN